MNNKLNCFNINEIGLWNEENTSNRVCLPKMQRGFVWKPAQIANLWDSICRGFPIGSMLVAKSDDSFSTLELLDGQQRVSSIKTGFYNPFNDENLGFLSLRKFPVLWIDIRAKQIPQNNKYSILITTQSHPWGFKSSNPSEKLSLEDRRGYLMNIKSKNNDLKNYLDIEPKDYSPWDSVCPIPISFITCLTDNEKINSFESFKEEFQKNIQGYFVSIKGNSKLVYNEVLNENDFKFIYEVLLNIKSILIPVLNIDLKFINFEDEEQDPTLFVRLNNGGTVISGEELIYSVFKARFPQFKDLVESIAADFIAPSKLINLYCRLSLAKVNLEEGKSPSFHKSIDLKAFNKYIVESRFKSQLISLIEESSFNDNRFRLCIKLFESYFASDPIPIILIKVLITENIDVFYSILVYLDLKNINSIEELSIDNLKGIISTIFYVSWFSSDKSKASNKLFEIIINTSDNNEVDWREVQNQLIEEKYIYPLLNPIDLGKLFDKSIVENKVIDDKLHSTFLKNNLPSAQPYLIENEDDWSFFVEYLNKIKWNKNLLLLAQREYIISEFQEFNDWITLDDTNRPWDWDHIFPHSWAYNRKNIHPLVKAYLNTVGNYRALSVAKNRSENNHVSPSERLNDNQVLLDSFVDKEDYNNYWSQFAQNDLRLSNDQDELLFIYQKAVLYRMLKIYTHFYELIY